MMLQVGDIVKLGELFQRTPADAHREFVVEKFLTKNINVRDTKTGQGMRGRPECFVFVRKSTYEELTAEIEKQPILTIGSVVTVKQQSRTAKWTYAPDQKFVVIAVKDRINIAKLGGENGRYWRMPAQQLEVVEV